MAPALLTRSSWSHPYSYGRPTEKPEDPFLEGTAVTRTRPPARADRQVRAWNGFNATLNVYRFSASLPGRRAGSMISRFCSAFETEFKRKSSRLFSSLAKYIWVTIMLKNPPCTLKWMWGG